MILHLESKKWISPPEIRNANSSKEQLTFKITFIKLRFKYRKITSCIVKEDIAPWKDCRLSCLEILNSVRPTLKKLLLNYLHLQLFEGKVTAIEKFILQYVCVIMTDG